MPRLIAPGGSTVVVDDELAEKLAGMGYEPEKKAATRKAPAKSDDEK